MSFDSIFKLETLATRRVNRTTTVGSSLALIFLLGKAFTLGNNQLCVSTVSIVVWNVSVACEIGVDDNIRFDALEAVLNVILFLGWTSSRGSTRGRIKLALVVWNRLRRVCGEGSGGIAGRPRALSCTRFQFSRAIRVRR